MANSGSVHNLLRDLQSIYGERTIFSVYDGNEISNISGGRFVEAVLKTAGYFSQNQIKGRHIAIAAPNSYRWVVVFFALAATGNTVIPLNPDLPADMLQWQCQKADISLVCHDNPETAGKLGDIPGISFDAIQANIPLSVEALYSHEEDETLLMLFTSGTTGQSKTVMLSTKNLFTSTSNIFSARKQDAVRKTHEKHILSLPLYHVGSIRCLVSQLERGIPIAIGRGAKYLFMDLPKLNPTHVDMVPAMAESFAKILRRTPREKWANYVGRNFEVVIAVGAAMKPGVARYLLEQGIQIDVMYGMTESAGDGAWCVLDETHIGTIGKPDGNISFRIEDGEILLRSDAVMKGYYKDPEETARVLVDGWLHTGDMGCCDEDGYYYITGRKKNVIILSNGENVNPEEIEAAFGECEAIEECLVYSDGKGICADVFPKYREAAAAVIKAYNESMPMYRQVYKVNYTAEPLPKTGSGKIKRKENR